MGNCQSTYAHPSIYTDSFLTRSNLFRFSLRSRFFAKLISSTGLSVVYFLGGGFSYSSRGFRNYRLFVPGFLDICAVSGAWCVAGGGGGIGIREGDGGGRMDIFKHIHIKG